MKSFSSAKEYVASRRDQFLLLLISTVTVMSAHPGSMTADTKIYLYTDPGKLLSRAVSLWDPHVGLGTVTHQNLGYLFPMGPYYWMMDKLGVPDWLAQRFWWIGLIFAAAIGARALARHVGMASTAASLTGAIYAFGPYFLHYIAKQSGLLPAWSAAPWLVICAVKAVEEKGWRWPARFALIVALISSLNASTPIYVLIGPVAWLFADVLVGRIQFKRVLIAGVKCLTTTVLVCYWWIAGLSIQGGFGLPILRFTETYEAIVKTALPQEILRGVGYWFFYGDDRLGRWVTAAGPYMTSPLVVTVSFAVVAVSLAGFFLIPKERIHNVIAILIVGLGVAVAGAPSDQPSPYGRLFTRFTETESGLAMRSTPRAAPVALMALSLGFGAACFWAATNARRKWRPMVLIGVSGLVVINGFPLFTGSIMTDTITYESIPKYWNDVTSRLDPQNDRVYEFPGTDFPTYIWGGTVDPVSPGLSDASIIARELVPLGSEPTANLVNAIETRLQNGWFEPTSLTGFSRLIRANRLLLRNDLNYRKYKTPRPDELWWALTNAGIKPSFTGPDLESQYLSLINDGQSMTQARTLNAPTVALFDTDARFENVSALPDNAATKAVVFGDGAGLIDLSALGLIGQDSAWLYDVSSTSDVVEGARRFYLTDTNRRQARHWYSVGFTLGRTERADETPIEDPSDSRLEPFASGPSDSQSVSILRGDISEVNASWYGNRISFTTEDRQENAFDGDIRTAWRSAVFRPAAGEFIEAVLRKPVTTDHITLVQPKIGAAFRKITKIRIETDGGSPIVATLGKASSTAQGERVDFPVRTFSRLKITVLEDSYGIRPSYAGLDGIGFAEVIIPGVKSAEYIRLPKVDLNKYLDLADTDWTVVLTRERIMQSTANQFEHEVNIQRIFDLPVAIKPQLKITARISGMAEDEALASGLGYEPRVVATRHLYGSAKNAGANVMDGDYETAWTAARSPDTKASLDFLSLSDKTRTLDIRVLTDGKHSIPSVLSLVDAGGKETLEAVDLSDGVATISLPSDFGSLATLTVTETDAVFVEDYFSGEPIEMPVAITEVEVNGTRNQPYEQTSECRKDLLFVDGKAIPLKVPSLSRPEIFERSPFDLTICGDLPSLGPGEHEVRTAKGWDTGIDIDRIVFGSLEATSSSTLVSTSIRKSPTSYSLTVPPTTEGVIITLNQSINRGWKAKVNGVDLGESFLVNGYSNGWQLPPSNEERTVQIDWTPQDRVNIALWISLLGGLALLAIAIWSRRRDLPAEQAGSIGQHAGHSPRAIAVQVATALVLLFFGGLGAGAGVLIAYLSRRFRLSRIWLAFLTTGAIGIVWAGTMYKQLRYRIPASMDWPSHFHALAPFIWASVALCSMWLVLDLLERSRAQTND